MKRARGFTLIELMISMVLSLLILAAMIGLFVNTSASHREMEKTHGVIENGRIAAQLLQDDLVHAGYWGGYVPQFDDHAVSTAPADVPSVIPNPCQPYAPWNSSHRNNLLGIAVQADEILPAGATCVSPLTKRNGTDVLTIRHAETCVPGEGNCAPDTPGRLYLQSSSCKAERNAGTAQGAASNTLVLSYGAATSSNVYAGLAIRTVSGTGAGQLNSVLTYNGSTMTATMSQPWSIVPDTTTTYAFEYMLGTGSFPLHERDCVGTGSPPRLPVTSGTTADKRRFVSNLYYVHDFPHPDRAGDVIPTLVRSQFDVSGGTLGQQAPVALIDGIEGFRVELGLDNVSDSGEAVNYTQAIQWADAETKTSPRNRGDGAPDEFVRCTVATPCTAAQLTNVVAVKLYMLVRSRDRTPGHLDNRTYCLGELDADGACPLASTVAAANDDYKRHVFSTSVPLINVSARRETPP
ncbi:MAG TPA: PilW family protein [Steroidobacter sp.]|uniref:PilW family protein n=1 Tax=Steroidobacter sp. TaxID=1978227 RepID=UPI002EDA5479